MHTDPNELYRLYLIGFRSEGDLETATESVSKHFAPSLIDMVKAQDTTKRLPIVDVRRAMKQTSDALTVGLLHRLVERRREPAPLEEVLAKISEMVGDS